MKFFTATKIFTGSHYSDLAIQCEEDGTIVQLLRREAIPPGAELNNFDGILCPGFINAHCHLELSHLKGQAKPGKGMAGFVSDIIPLRTKFSGEQIKAAAEAAVKEMYSGGTVAVGDICNTDHTFELKAKSGLYFHNFIELFDLHPSKADEVLEKGKELISKSPGFSSLVPHAPYTVTPALLHLIAEEHMHKDQPICIHSQESIAESDFFSKSGPIYESFLKMNMDLSWVPTRKTSLEYFLSYLMHISRVQLVHNTYTSVADFNYIRTLEPTSDLRYPISRIFLCTCPNANLFIENKLPDYTAWINSGFKITVGTDSYASNHSLSILWELKTIQTNFPDLKLETLLTWATKSGAEFLGINGTYGSFEKGKKPGIVLIKDLEGGMLTERSFSERII